MKKKQKREREKIIMKMIPNLSSRKDNELERQREIKRKKEGGENRKFGFHKQNTYMDVDR